MTQFVFPWIIDTFENAWKLTFCFISCKYLYTYFKADLSLRLKSMLLKTCRERNWINKLNIKIIYLARFTIPWTPLRVCDFWGYPEQSKWNVCQKSHLMSALLLIYFFFLPLLFSKSAIRKFNYNNSLSVSSTFHEFRQVTVQISDTQKSVIGNRVKRKGNVVYT